MITVSIGRSPLRKAAVAFACTGLALALCPAVALADDAAGTQTEPAAQESADAATTKAKVVKYTVKYKAKGGTLAKGTVASAKVKEKTKVKLADAPARTGYIFSGWLNSVTEKVVEPKSTYKVTSDVAFTAQWEKETAAVKTKSKKSGGNVTKISAAIDKSASNVKGGIQYQVKPKRGSWTSAKDGAWSAKSSAGLEALKVKLTGDLKDKFDVYYRVKVQDYGWMAWTKNGAQTGTGDMSKTLYLVKPIEDYQVQLVPKADKSAAKKLAKANKGLVSFASLNKNLKKFAKVVLTKKAAKAKASSTKWLIVVDTHLNYVALFTGKVGNWKFYDIYRCVTGKASTPTVKGNFSIGSKGYEFGHGYSCWYWSQIHSDYLFHSQPYWPGSKTNIRYKAMGRNQSHGCVRLRIDHAKFIHDKVPSGTRVYIY